jgi:hypothetical protein
MKQHNADYQVVPYPKHRRAEAVLYRSVQRKPMIHGLIEGDVTRARAFLRDSSCGCLEGIHRCRRSTVERWAYRQWACLGKGQVGASLPPPQHS